MAHYVISYDLHHRRNYQQLWDALRNAGAARVLESLWLLESTHDAGVIREILQRTVDNDDSVVVIELKPGSGWSAIRAQEAGANWLERNIRSYRNAA